MSKQESEYWNAVGSDWSRGRPDRLWRQHSDAVNRAWLEESLPAGSIDRILKTDAFDEACSDGLLKLLQSRARSVTEIDVSTSTLAAARARQKGLNGVAADTRRLPFESDSFDVVVSNSTLDHFRTATELLQSLAELHRILRVGGSLLISLDNSSNPLVAIRNALPFRLLHSIGLVPYYVGVTFGPKRLGQELARIGFEIRQTRSLMHCIRSAAVFRARRIEKFGDSVAREQFLKHLMKCEARRQSSFPYFWGNFVAVTAIKR